MQALEAIQAATADPEALDHVNAPGGLARRE
jgi:hypothetical protein